MKNKPLVKIDRGLFYIIMPVTCNGICIILKVSQVTCPRDSLRDLQQI